jgi:hypothetical protein
VKEKAMLKEAHLAFVLTVSGQPGDVIACKLVDDGKTVSIVTAILAPGVTEQTLYLSPPPGRDPWRMELSCETTRA